MNHYAAKSSTHATPLPSGTLKALRSKTALDLSFQSLQRWTPAIQSKFIASLLTGMAPSKIVIANIRECKSQHAEGTAEWLYFDKWEKLGYEYISVDGNNRTITIAEYLDSNIKVPVGSYFIPVDGGYTRVEINKSNCTYGTHPSVLQAFVDEHVKITIEEYVSATRDTLKTLFLAINDGVKLNDQEIRNAYPCEVADWVRTMSDKYTSQLRNVFSLSEINRRKGDELIVTMMVYSSSPEGYRVSINKGNKNKAYTEEATVKSSLSLTERIFKSFFGMKDFFAMKALRGMGTVMNFYMLVDHLTRNNYKIIDEDALMKWFMATETKRNSNQDIIWTVKGKSRSYEACSKVLFDGAMTARFNTIMSDFASIPDNVVVQKDKRRSFNTTAERVELWERQGGISPDGVQIPAWEIDNRIDYPIDHIVPHSKGGTTTLDNGQITTRKYNSDKSDKVVEV